MGDPTVGVAAAATAVPGENDPMVDAEIAYTEEEFAKIWAVALNAEKTLGKPKEWNGEDSGFDDFDFKFANWLSNLPGGPDALLQRSSRWPKQITLHELSNREKVMARSIAQALRSLVSGKALPIIKNMPESANGFEAWRLLHKEYRPIVAGRRVALLEAVTDDKPGPNESFIDWLHRWTDLVKTCEIARQRQVDDDIKVATVTKNAPEELKTHLAVNASAIADSFPMLIEVIKGWAVAKRQWKPPPPPVKLTPKDPNAMEIGGMKGKFGKGRGGPFRQWFKGARVVRRPRRQWAV